MKYAKRYKRYAFAAVVTGLVMAALMVLLYSSAAAGATINVNTTADELNADSDCSLREAVQAANTDAAPSCCPRASMFSPGWEQTRGPTLVVTWTSSAI